MKRLTFSLILLAALAVAVEGSDNRNRTVMTVAGTDVTLGEFEYLYKKNNLQQQHPTTLEQYVDMFVNYKLKVADAKAEGIDTTADYRREMSEYARELARPYMRDKAVDDSLVAVAYEHMKENIEVSHIMLPRDRTNPSFELADSLLGLLDAGADFGELAEQFTTDNGSRHTRGYMGFISARSLPYAFEDAAYNTPVGCVSRPVLTDFGIHLIKVHSRRPDRGEIKARHIVKLTMGLDSLAIAVKKEQIDSIYKALESGADFIELAKQTTDEGPGQKSGGELPWFGTGRMIKTFEDVAFGLEPGQMSEPFETQFGYHVVLCEDRRNLPAIEQLEESLREGIMRDARAALAVERAVDNYGRSVGACLNSKAVGRIGKALGKNKRTGGIDAKLSSKLRQESMPAFYIGNEKGCTVGEILSEVLDEGCDDCGKLTELYEQKANSKFRKGLSDRMLATLPEREPDYRNLINEYSDGLLLYEVSNRKVWDKANKDMDGLEQYFQQHKSDFQWQQPHYAGFVVLAVNDSIAAAGMARLASLPEDTGVDELIRELRKECGTNAKIEQVITAKGDSPIVDYLNFGGERPQPKGRWASWCNFRGEIVDQPRSAKDVKGAVSVAYQQALEAEWIKELRSKYAFSVDESALESLD